MSNVKDRFRTLLNHYAQFNQIEYLMVENKDGKTVVTGFSRKKNALVIAKMPEMPEFERKVCLTNLAFLKRIFELEKVMGEKGTVELIPGTDLEGNDIVERFNIRGPGINIGYQTVDPKVLIAVNKPPTRVEEKFKIELDLKTEHKTDFDEAHSLQKMMAKKEEDQTVRFYLENSILMAELPYTRTDKVDIRFSETTSTYQSNQKFSASILSKMLNIMASNQNGQMMIQDGMLKVLSTAGEIEFHMYLIHQK